MLKGKSGQRFTVATMGCRFNQFETEQMRDVGIKMGFQLASKDQEANLVLVNTCSVTGESDRQARQIIRRAMHLHPDAKIIVTGCYAQRDPEAIATIPGVTMVLGNREKLDWEKFLQDSRTDARTDTPEQHIFVSDPATWSDRCNEPIQHGFKDHARAFLQIQNGCNERCTFCIIPTLRGPSRSLKPETVLQQAKNWIRAGFQELVLTGINLGRFGSDLTPPSSLADLLKSLLNLQGLGRIRLSSLDPADLNEELITLLAENRQLCGYLHLSIQSGDDFILKRMGRRLTRDQLLNRIQHVRQARPDVVLGADLIVGFPTESEKAFLNTVTLANEARLSNVHVFRYSDREGTSAAKIPPRFRVAGDVMRERSKRLRQTSTLVRAEVMKRTVGQSVEVLIESVEKESFYGKTGEFLPVRCSLHESTRVLRGDLIPISITGLGTEIETGMDLLTGVVQKARVV